MRKKFIKSDYCKQILMEITIFEITVAICIYMHYNNNDIIVFQIVKFVMYLDLMPGYVP